MTRPVYEPSQARSDSELGFGNRQLFRRPRPVAQADIPGFHAHKESSLVIATGNDERLEWDEWIIDDSTIFEAGTLSGSDLTDVKLLVSGWYAIHCWAFWQAPPASGFGGIMMIHDDTDIEAEPSLSQGHVYPENFHLDTAMVFQIVRYLAPDFVTQVPPSFSWVDRLEFWVVQNSGVNRTITDAYCNIGYLGPRSTDTTPSS